MQGWRIAWVGLSAFGLLRAQPAQDVNARIAEATAGIRAHPRDANAWVSRAAFYLLPPQAGGKPAQENVERAIPDLEKALQLDAANYYARHNYAHAAFLLGYDDFAIAEFGRAIAINPQAARSYMGRGWAYYDECKLDRARADFAVAVSLDGSLAGEVASPAQLREHRQACGSGGGGREPEDTRRVDAYLTNHPGATIAQARASVGPR